MYTRIQIRRDERYNIRLSCYLPKISFNLKGRMPAKQRAPADVVASEPTQTTRATMKDKSQDWVPRQVPEKSRKQEDRGVWDPGTPFLPSDFQWDLERIIIQSCPEPPFCPPGFYHYMTVWSAHSLGTKLITFKSCEHQNKNNDETRMEAHGLHSCNSFTALPYSPALLLVVLAPHWEYLKFEL